ncbi:citrate synthase [Aspergillus terreus]|uniref:Citrate synthase n=1 Tax=Aspergillus terreus TaxID=33178 RepID=A0A5M3ZCV1_ASPTE|nr:hypothetical protein ATETN484_0011050100 [Aspergillus terreus]GFF19143.1 citrate synthase [Aspergillus terreus]
MAGLLSQPSANPDAVKISCFRRFALLNADHGMALSVFSALVTASSLPDPISSLVSAVAAAYGPLHFGATETAHRSLREIGSPDNVPSFIEAVKKGRRKLFGYGHRAYKGVDPRVRPIQSILKDLDMSSNALLKIAERIEQTASTDDYFLKRGLYPNADFYGNFVFTGIGFEPDMIPAAMLAQRIIGIMAHWREYMPGQKRLIIFAAAIASTFSPLSANIYYPALNSIAADLHVSISQVNLTITAYMICQGLAPTLMGSFADQAGRRPAYILCFLIYISGNIALALQHSFPALLVLRGLQSSGSSGTVALASAAAADVTTSAERGTYMGITSLGNIIAPSLGPILGGILSEYLGKLTLPNPLATLRLLFELPTGLILLSNGVVFASYYSVMAAIPFQLKTIYHLSDLQIGLSFIPAGVGSLTSATFNGIMVDWNYRRTMEKAGLSMLKSPAQGRRLFSIEKARLQIGLPMTILSALTVLLYGFAIELHPPLYVTLGLIFTISFCITSAYNVMNILLVDLYYGTPATAMAANNLAYPVPISPILLTYGDTQELPIISARGLQSDLTYLLLFYDLDVIYGETATVALHWYQPNMTTQPNPEQNHAPRIQSRIKLHSSNHDDEDDLILANRTSGAEYIAPRPPPKSHHRYVYLLFHQKADYKFPSCFSHIFPPTADARAGFDVRQFMRAAKLDAPVAGNYFFVEFDGPLPTPTTPVATPTTTSLRSAPCQGLTSTTTITGAGAATAACEYAGRAQAVL